jgi:hypothetical protein
VRGCEEKPTLLDDVIDDPVFKSFYRSCSTDLCNIGDGTKSSTQENLSPDNYSGENLLVPGLPFNAGAKCRSSLIIVLISFVLIVVEIN